MGSEFFKHPAKRLDKEFRAMGARRKRESSGATAYIFPDGGQLLVLRNIGPARARIMLNNAQQRYGPVRDPLGRTEKRSGAPTIDFDRLQASRHALERLALMQGQADLSYPELLHALRIPERVLWSPDHGAWLWVGARVAIAMSFTPEGVAVIRTLLWTTRELWDKNPRPEVRR